MQNAQHAIPFYVTVIPIKGGKLASFPHNGHTFQVHTNNEWLNQELSIQFRCHLKIPYKRANEKKKYMQKHREWQQSGTVKTELAVIVVERDALCENTVSQSGFSLNSSSKLLTWTLIRSVGIYRK